MSGSGFELQYWVASSISVCVHGFKVLTVEIWEFPKLGVPFWGPYNKDPTI